MGEPIALTFRDADRFLSWEARQPERHELVGGVVHKVEGGTADADLIGVNVGALLGRRLKGRGFLVHGCQLKVRSANDAVMYPDVFVRCGPHRGEVTIVDDPVLVVEVLSPSTEQHDLTRKRWAYQAIPSLRTVLFIDPDRPVIEILAREDSNVWRSRMVEGLEASLGVAALGIELPLAEIYARHRARAGAPRPADDLSTSTTLTRSPRSA